LKEKIKDIKWLITDCDGVLTDAGVYYGEKGEELKRFSIRDGMGVERIRKLTGIDVAIVTGEDTQPLKKRAEKLKISELHTGVKNKLELFENFIKEKNINWNNIAYIGDDYNDYDVLVKVGISACPADAMGEIKKISNYLCITNGGHGAFREFAEWLIDGFNN
jgi:YrbI family 3-deoxy-D-manno-octulosonate 8-phosphate phosphatase